MLILYKDPDGEGVFSAHDDPVQATTVLGGPPAQCSELQEENDNLRKKVKQLEDTISEYQVIKHNDLCLTAMLWYTLTLQLEERLSC